MNSLRSAHGPKYGMVLAAGLGTRMRPLTNTRPKPLIEVAGKTLLDRALDWMQEGAVEQAVVNTHYLAEQIETHLRTRRNPKIILSSEADTLLETGGGITKALPYLGQSPFICANSDTICVNGAIHAIARLSDHWDNDEMDALLLLHPTEKAIGYEGRGDFNLSPTGELLRRKDAPHANYVFTGVQLLHPRLFKNAPQGAFSMNLLYDQNHPRMRAIIHDGNWLHVGDPAGLKLAEDWFAQQP